MAFALTNAANYVSSASSTSHTLTFGWTAVAGRLLVVWAAVGQNSVPSAPSGWFQFGGTTNATAGFAGFYFKIAAGTETNFVLTTSNVAAALSVMEFSNTYQSTAYILDVRAATSATAATTGALDTQVVHQDDSLVLAAYSNVGGATYTNYRIHNVSNGTTTGSATNVTFLFNQLMRQDKAGEGPVDYRATLSSSVANIGAYIVVRGEAPDPITSVAQSVAYTESGSAGTSHQKTGITTTAGRQLVLAIATSSSSATEVSSVVDSAGNTWARRRSQANTAASCEIWATTDESPAAISSGSITVTTGTSKGVAFRLFELADAVPGLSPFDTRLSTVTAGISVTTASGTTHTMASAGTPGLYSLGLCAIAANAVGRTWSNPSWSSVVDGSTQSGTTQQDESNVTSNNVTLYTSSITMPGGGGGGAATPVFSVTTNVSTTTSTLGGYLSYFATDDRSHSQVNDEYLPTFARQLSDGYEWRVVNPYATVPVVGQLWPRGFPKGTQNP